MPIGRWIMWRGLIEPSLERLVVTGSDSGVLLDGLLLQAFEGQSYVMRYQLQVDTSWATTSLHLALEDGHKLGLLRDANGNWSVDGTRRIDLSACVDVDIEWSPSTNTLPIRRLNLPPGARKAVTAAWIRLPSLAVRPLEQSYERLAERRYRYASGNFVADLDVDDDGLVTRYGVNWEAVASSGSGLFNR